MLLPHCRAPPPDRVAIGAFIEEFFGRTSGPDREEAPLSTPWVPCLPPPPVQARIARMHRMSSSMHLRRADECCAREAGGALTGDERTPQIQYHW